MLVHFDRSPILPALIILCREILVSGLREFLAEQKKESWCKRAEFRLAMLPLYPQPEPAS